MTSAHSRTRLGLIRHGETDWNHAHRIQGQQDIPLNATGRRQATELRDGLGSAGVKLEPVSAIYCSDLVRARSSAAPLAEYFGLRVIALTELRERHHGRFEGLTGEEFRQRYPEAWTRHVAREPEYELDGGESLRQFDARARGTLQDIINRHPGQTVLVVSHAGILDMALRHAIGRPLEAARDYALPHCSPLWLDCSGPVWHLNDATWIQRRNRP